MAARTVDHESRRKAVLEATINCYIKSGEPVASDDIARNFGLSSATVRNIFAELEEAGYLTHPYTSGGRIPTSKGYRYYVDFLASQMEVLAEQKNLIIQEYHQKISRLEDVLEKTSEVIAEITHYAGIVSSIEWQDKVFYNGLSLVLEQPEFRDCDRIRLLIKMVEDKQRLFELINRDFSGSRKVTVFIGEELNCPEVEGCSLIVSSYSVNNRPSGRLAVLGPKRMEYNKTISALEYISEVLSETLNRV